MPKRKKTGYKHHSVTAQVKKARLIVDEEGAWSKKTGMPLYETAVERGEYSVISIPAPSGHTWQVHSHPIDNPADSLPSIADIQRMLVDVKEGDIRHKALYSTNPKTGNPIGRIIIHLPKDLILLIKDGNAAKILEQVRFGRKPENLPRKVQELIERKPELALSKEKLRIISDFCESGLLFYDTKTVRELHPIEDDNKRKPKMIKLLKKAGFRFRFQPRKGYTYNHQTNIFEKKQPK